MNFSGFALTNQKLFRGNIPRNQFCVLDSIPRGTWHFNSYIQPSFEDNIVPRLLKPNISFRNLKLFETSKMAGIVVVFDFDKTIIDSDSDNWVVDELGASDFFNQLLPTMPWNSVMVSSIFKIICFSTFFSTLKQILPNTIKRSILRIEHVKFYMFE